MMSHPFELSQGELDARLDDMVGVTFDDIQSQFLVLPKRDSYIEYPAFQAAYETLKRQPGARCVRTR